MLNYKGYIGQVTFDAESDLLHGEVIGLRDVITFQGQSVKEIKQAFKESIDDYLQWCKELGEIPEKTYSGKFNLRIPPELHAKVDMCAKMDDTSLNDWIKNIINNAVNEKLKGAAETVIGKVQRVQDVFHKAC